MSCLGYPQFHSGVSVLHGFMHIRTVCKTVHPLSLKTSFYFYCWEQKHLLSAEYVLAKEKRKDLNCFNTFLHDIGFTAPLDSIFSLEFQVSSA